MTLTDAGRETATDDFVCFEDAGWSAEGLQPAVRRPTPAAIEIDRMIIVFTEAKLGDVGLEFFEASQGSGGFRDQHHSRALRRTGQQGLSTLFQTVLQLSFSLTRGTSGNLSDRDTHKMGIL